ncbi:hypothetical protein [Colwellia sp. MEBiC06753]
MNKTVVAIFLFVFMSAQTVAFEGVASTGKEEVAYITSVCDAQVQLKAKPLIKSQHIVLNDQVSIDINQWLSTSIINSRKLAVNIICQKLTGANYTGSKEEWMQFIQTAVNGFKKTKATDIQLTIVGLDERVYKESENSQEYTITANFEGNKQIIRNVAILDKKANTVYTLSVSGEVGISTQIEQEFVRVVQSFKLNH